jgi:hypothetical protein
MRAVRIIAAAEAAPAPRKVIPRPETAQSGSKPSVPGTDAP